MPWVFTLQSLKNIQGKLPAGKLSLLSRNKARYTTHASARYLPIKQTLILAFLKKAMEI